jgi:hypothetical protein
VFQVDEVVNRCCQSLGVHPRSVRHVWPVQRPNLPTGDYVLVEFARDDGTLLVAIVDRETATVTHRAALPTAARGPVALSADAARRVAGASPDAPAGLVWAPCAATLSPFYPLWQIELAPGVRYVDQQGRLADLNLEPPTKRA